MFVVLLKFSENKSQASQHMEAHNHWIGRGFDDCIFLLSGGIQPRLGGAVITPGRTDYRLAFLINK